jgi:hypothetical protein
VEPFGHERHAPDLNVFPTLGSSLSRCARRVDGDFVSLRQPFRQFPVHNGHGAALLFAGDYRILGLINDRDLHGRRIVAGGFWYCERHKKSTAAKLVPDRGRDGLLSSGLVSVALASGEFPGGADDDVRVITLDVMAAVGHADMIRAGEVRGNLILQIGG